MAIVEYADLAPGMAVTATTAWTATGATAAITGTIVSVAANCVTLDTGDTAPNPAYTDAGSTVTFDHTSGVADVPEPDQGTILLDDAGAAWQRIGNEWLSINGDQLAWADFLTAHPTYTTMADTPITPLPAPVAPYPATIAPGDARLGMDLRVTVTYTGGGSKVVRGVCPWIQENLPPDDDTPSLLCLPPVGGEALVADPEWLEAVTNNPGLRALIGGRFSVQYDPVPAGVALLVEQMQDWTAGPVWDTANIPEPPIGSVVRSRNGVAWQRTGDATEDGPLIDGGVWVLAGQGMWSSVTGDYPRSFLWLWGAAAPFNIQEPA